jgi:hypothetical protein
MSTNNTKNNSINLTNEVKMSSDPELAKYLHALGATDKEDIVSEERARRQQARQSRVAADIEAMDTDEQKVRN